MNPNKYKTYENGKDGPLLSYFLNNKSRPMMKWLHYFDIYETYFSRYRNTPVNMLEIGVAEGGSLEMWQKYFGKKARIFGVDINPDCKRFEEGNVKVFIGDQADRNFLRTLKQKIPKLDIILDDGGHTMNQQIATFEELYPHIKDDGVYLCEDLHTSYWAEFGGGYKKKSSFIEYSKNLIDKLNTYHSKEKQLRSDEFTDSAYSIAYYDSVVAIVKSKRVRLPKSMTTGLPTYAKLLGPALGPLTRAKKKYLKS